MCHKFHDLTIVNLTSMGCRTKALKKRDIYLAGLTLTPTDKIHHT